MNLNFIVILQSLLLFLYTIYSYSQIDLNLTLSNNTFYQKVQNMLIQLGYYERPLSAFIFIIILLGMYGVYFIILKLLKRNKINLHQLFLLILLSASIAIIAYPAYSHDIFNYLFDARILTKYHLNPYFFKALDFPGDPWIRFMHWTHRTYPYGPLWLLITLPFSYLGLGKFVLTLVNFKLMFALFYFGNLYLLYKLCKLLKIRSTNFVIGFFALNPLVVTESLISPHNEVIMLFFLLLSLYYYFKKRTVSGIIFLLISAGIKFITILFLPLILLPHKIRILFRKNSFILTLIIIQIFSLIFLTIYREPYPWYFIILLGLAPLYNEENIIYFSIFLSLGLSLQYVPFLYFGTYDQNVRILQWILLAVPVVIYTIGLVLVNIRHKLNITRKQAGDASQMPC